MDKQKFVIIDGHALIHRAYHALPPLTTKDGRIVNAVYGFSMILLRVIEDLKPDCIAVAMDLPGGTFRHEKFEEYKATRLKPTDDLVEQFALVREVIKAFNIPIYEKPGFEADDIIGTIANKLTKNGGVDTFIVTGDLDELQLVDETTKVYTMKRGFTDTVVYDIAKVKERYGINPKQFVDFKALKGDPSDNIPGVAGIGEKTATELIKEYDNLEEIYKNLDKINPKVAKKLKEGEKSAYLSRELSTIVADIPISLDVVKCKTEDYDREKVFELFRDLEFKSLLTKIPGVKQVDNFKEDEKKDKSKAHFSRKNYQLVKTEEELKNIISELKNAEKIVIKVKLIDETNPYSKTCGIALSYMSGKGLYLPIGHKDANGLEKETILKHLKPILESNIPKIGHNIKQEYIALINLGIKLSNISFDTMIGAYLLNANARAIDLTELAFSEFGIEMAEISELVGNGRNKKSFYEIDSEKAALFAAEEVDMIFRLEERIRDNLAKIDLLDLTEKIEIPLIPVLAEMELSGIKIDTNILRKSSDKFGKQIKELENKIYKIAGESFNISSPAQLQKILFEKLKLQDQIEKKELKRLPSGGYSTGADELEKLKEKSPIIGLVQEYRELTKLKNTYLDTLPLLVDEKGRVHTTFNQAVVATGRLSSSNPNLQNIPIRSDLGLDIRRAFVTEEGYSILSADYSQIELRVIAHIAKDEAMIESFNEGRDIHTATAAEVYNLPEKKVTSAMRRNAKAVNFGIVYGVSPHGLQRSTGMGYDEAKAFIDKYFELHKSIKIYLSNVVEEARERGYTETIFGRRRYLPELNSSNFIVKSAAERMAMNMPIQGTAADLIKLAMIEIDKELAGRKSRMLLQVHDELVFEVAKTEIADIRKIVKEKMEKVTHLAVPIIADISLAENWGDAK